MGQPVQVGEEDVHKLQVLEDIVYALIVGIKFLMKEVSPAQKKCVQIVELGWLEMNET